MKNIIIILILAIGLTGCEKENINDGLEPCQCTKLYFSDIGIVIDSVQVTSNTCESVGEYPHDIQHAGGTNFVIMCD